MAYTYRNMEHLLNTPGREDSVGPALSVKGSYEPHAFGPGHIPPARFKNFKEVIDGRISLSPRYFAFALINPGLSHLFISTQLSSQTLRGLKHLGYRLSVQTPLGEVVERV